MALAPFGPHFGFGIYIHWPYCSRICPYCDFNVYAAKDRDTDPLVAAIEKDIGLHRARLPEHGALDTVYFGGGTPSLLQPAEIARLLEAARTSFGLKPDAEVTLEANPNDILTADLRGLAAAGVNRLSIGVQSLRDNALAFLGRDHDAIAARAAVERAIKVFPNISVDLIYARPSQSPDEWADELADVLALGAPHLSLYELTIEQRTAFGKSVERGDLIPMDPDAQADLYELTQSIADSAGLPAYEISNHAMSAAYRSRHNSIYWNGGDWIGVGPGAHGRLTVAGRRYASEAQRQPAAYIANVQALGSGWGEASALYPLDVARELLAMGLRVAEGIDLGRIEALSGKPVPRDKIAVFEEENWARLDGTRLWLTPRGRLLADALTAELAP
ncbi:radical SAM family heme chaperone HemW [Hyphomonas johnsonii]|uniref:radical SAM family heme chaperone HemW n=1 Tax=Hyphomonas johnsonii TaxID=81031 RepID=UPI00240F3442|nr:radical SAM family heme chaperone HemW [Hyphomonas johnsonii]